MALRARWRAAQWVACILSLAILFRFQIASGFGFVTGDIYDARIEITLLQHWANVFGGWEDWRQPLFFSPTLDTLGYNDGYLLYGLAYSALRWMGSDPFLAADLVNVLMRATSFWAFLIFAERVCGVHPAWALLGAVLSSLSNGLYMQSKHAQLLTVGLAPLLGWLLWRAVGSLRLGHDRRAAAWGVAAAVLFDLWLMTAFYTLWFTVFFGALLALCAVAQSGVRGWPRVSVWPPMLAVAALVCGAIPFVMTYVPTARETGMHGFDAVLQLTPTLPDLIDFGAGSLVYGAVERRLAAAWPSAFVFGSEHTVGLPVLLWAMSLAGGVAAWRAAADPQRLWWRSLALATAIALPLCLRIGSVSPWWLVYTMVPGAAAVRAVTRFLLFLSLPATLLAMHGLSCWARRTVRFGPVLLAALLVAEELNDQSRTALDRGGELRFLAQLPAAPKECTVFFVAGPRPGYLEVPSLTVGVDAMLVAELIHLPTLNGHASFVPEAYALPFSTTEDYRRRVAAIAIHHDLTAGLCSLDPVAMAWEPFTAVSRAPMGQPVVLGLAATANDRFLGSGWSGAEPQGRWTNGTAASLGFLSPAPGRDLVMTVAAWAFAPAGKASRVVVLLNGHRVVEWAPDGLPQTLQVPIPASLLPSSGVVGLRFEIVKPRSPFEAHVGADTRKLGLFVQSFTLSEPAAATQ